MRMIVLTLLSLWLGACAGGEGGTVAGGGGGGIVGTGKQVAVSGEVTGFGSVIVNGIEFSRAPGASPVSFAFDNTASTDERVLRQGMVVSLAGEYDPATARGTYTAIVFSPELRGPLDPGSVDPATGQFTVLGCAVRTGVSTVFEGVADIFDLQARQGQGLELEVSGYLGTDSTVQATRVASKASGSGGGRVQVKGQVGGLTGTSFTIGAVTVSLAGATFAGMYAAELGTAGLVVEVRGMLAGNSIIGARIEKKSPAVASAGRELSIKGIAASAPVAGAFVLSGPDGPVQVSVGKALFFRGNGAGDVSIIKAGARLEVEGGVMPDGSLSATKVSSETERTLRLEGDLGSIDGATATFVLNGVRVAVESVTSFKDSRSQPVPVLTLSGLAAGDHLQVYGFVSPAGQAVASQVERFNPSSKAMLQGVVTAVSSGAGQLSILGITVVPAPGAEIVGAADFAAFIAQIAPESTIVRAKGILAGAIFLADSLEIQR